MNNNNNNNNNKKLKRIELFLEDGDFESAHKYCEKLLDEEPELAKVYFYKLMIDLNIKKTEDFKNVDVLFDNNPNFVKALRFADNDFKIYLQSILTEVKESNINKEKERIYINAKDDFNNKLYKSAKEKFLTIENYNNSSEMIKKCDFFIEEKQKEAIKTQQKRWLLYKKILKFVIVGCSSIAVVFAIFAIINNYIVPSSKYNKACELFNDGKYKEAYLIFSKNNNFADSSEKCKECTKHINDEDFLINHPDFSNLHVGDTIEFGKFYNNLQEKNYYWRDRSTKIPIEWLVLAIDGDKALLISKYVLTKFQFWREEKPYWSGWCMAREYLNGEFLDSFSDEGKENIATTKVAPDSNSKSKAYQGETVEDRIFILSVKEAEKYFKNDQERKTTCVWGSDDNDFTVWSLRTASFFSSNQKGHGTCVLKDGSIYSDDLPGGAFNGNGRQCIRPSMWVYFK